jgi:hypothetical protein
LDAKPEARKNAGQTFSKLGIIVYDEGDPVGHGFARAVAVAFRPGPLMRGFFWDS